MSLNVANPRWIHVVEWHDPIFKVWHQTRFASDVDAKHYATRLEREGAEFVHIHSRQRKWSQPMKAGVTWRTNKCCGPLLTPTQPQPPKRILISSS